MFKGKMFSSNRPFFIANRLVFGVILGGMLLSCAPRVEAMFSVFQTFSSLLTTARSVGRDFQKLQNTLATPATPGSSSSSPVKSSATENKVNTTEDNKKLTNIFSENH